MPFNIKIPGVLHINVKGHTGQWLDSPANKTTAYMANAATPERLPPQRPTTRLPRIELSRVTDFTRYPSERAVEAALANTPLYTTHNQVFNGVTAFLNGEIARLQSLPGRAGLPTMIIVGEHHSHKTAVTALSAAMVHQQGTGGGILLREMRPDGDNNPVFSNMERAAQQLTLFHQGDPAGADIVGTNAAGYARAVVKHQLAHHSGYTVKPFDVGRAGSTDMEMRERQMKGSISAQLINNPAGPFIVSTGNYHLAPIMEAFKEHANVVGIASMHPPTGGPAIRHWNNIPRKSYSLANPSVHVFRAIPALEAAAFNYVAYAHAHGIDVTGGVLPRAGRLPVENLP